MLANKLDYKLQGIEDVQETFDMITMFEMLEHVPDPSGVLGKAVKLLNPGGYLFLSTINRTPVSWFTTIFMGEQVLKIVPSGTHTWSKYINEYELREWVKDQNEIEFVRSDGCLYVPGNGWRLTENKSIGNYFMALRRREN
jgi:polyprenyldihydroxybenzoate methyltransferase / 3-demethylubiquinol 3-O-methyltransferase